jgi:hypothetical protein
MDFGTALLWDFIRFFFVRKFRGNSYVPIRANKIK